MVRRVRRSLRARCRVAMRPCAGRTQSAVAWANPSRRAQPPRGLERSGALCYPKCKQATPSYRVGPVCWQHCADGWVDEGALCRKSGSIETVAKKSYGRGAGSPMTCADGLVEDAALCYPPCADGYYGVGPVCWERCPLAQGYPVDGGAVCCENKTVCTEKILNLASGLPIAVMEAILSGGDPKKSKSLSSTQLKSGLALSCPSAMQWKNPRTSPPWQPPCHRLLPTSALS